MRVTTFRWSAGVFCSIIGTLMLVEPHQFASPTYATIQPHLVLWGIAFLGAGMLLLVATALAASAAFMASAHAIVAIVFLLVAYGFVTAGGLTGTASYAVLGIGTLAAFLVPRLKVHREANGDLLALLIGLSALINGLLMLLVPGQFGAPAYVYLRPYLSLYGAAFAGAGAFSPWPSFAHRPTG